MAKVVYRKTKKGNHYVFSSSFKTMKEAINAARKQAKKYKTYEPGTPFRWGTGWHIYLIKKDNK